MESDAGGSINESEVDKGKTDKADDDSSANAVELQEWQYGDGEKKEADFEEDGYVREEQEDEDTEVWIQSDSGSHI